MNLTQLRNTRTKRHLQSLSVDQQLSNLHDMQRYYNLKILEWDQLVSRILAKYNTLLLNHDAQIKELETKIK